MEGLDVIIGSSGSRALCCSKLAGWLSSAKTSRAFLYSEPSIEISSSLLSVLVFADSNCSSSVILMSMSNFGEYTVVSSAISSILSVYPALSSSGVSKLASSSSLSIGGQLGR